MVARLNLLFVTDRSYMAAQLHRDLNYWSQYIILWKPHLSSWYLNSINSKSFQRLTLGSGDAQIAVPPAVPPAPLRPHHQKRYSNEGFCTTPQTVHDCYVTYLEKYGIHSGPYYLPSFERLDVQLKGMPLTNICREFDELMVCLRLVAFDCISIPVFERFTHWYGKVNEEAVAYVQNHAFFEYACGVGKPAFLANHDCLSRAFTTQSLTQRINACLPTDADMCTRAISAVECVKQSLAMQCSPTAGAAACGAATNIAQRAQEVSPMCIQEMNMRCSSSSLLIWITFLALISSVLLS